MQDDKRKKLNTGQGQARRVIRGLILMLIGASLLSACVSKDAAERSPEQRQRVESYLQTAAHLTPDQKQAMRQGRPFVGMTFAEADLAMRRHSPASELSHIPYEVMYRGHGGAKYYL